MSLLEEKIKTKEENFATRSGQSLVALLQEVQEQYNYLPEEVLRKIAREYNLALMDIYRVATFYKSFTLHPRGRHKIVVCSGTACHLRGGERITEEISRVLGIKPGETSQDGEYSLENVNCLGACALAPLVVVDGEYHGNMRAAVVESFIKERRQKYKGKSAEALNQEIGQKALDGCSCARLLAGENK